MTLFTARDIVPIVCKWLSPSDVVNLCAIDRTTRSQMNNYDVQHTGCTVHTTIASGGIIIYGATYQWTKLAYTYTSTIHNVSILRSKVWCYYRVKYMRCDGGLFNIIRLRTPARAPRLYIYTQQTDAGAIIAKYIITSSSGLLNVLDAGTYMPIIDIMIDYSKYVGSTYTPGLSILLGMRYNLTSIVQGLVHTNRPESTSSSRMDRVESTLLSCSVSDILAQN